MDFKFLVNKVIVPGFIKPASIVFTKSKLDEAVYSTEIFFEAPLAITLKIENFLRQFGFADSKNWIKDEEPEITHSWKKYTGSKTQILTFYKALGIELPSLIEGKEPEIKEVIGFVSSRSTAKASLDIKAITSIFIEYQTIEATLNDLETVLFHEKMLFLRLRSISPVEDYSIIGDFLAKKRVLESLIKTQKEAYKGAFLVLSDYLPSILVPEQEIHFKLPTSDALASTGALV